MTADFYVEIEIPGQPGWWSVGNYFANQEAAEGLYAYLLGLGLQAQLVKSESTSEVIRHWTDRRDDHPATVESSVIEVDTELRKSGIRLPSVEDLAAKVKSEMHAAEFEFKHLTEKAVHLWEKPAPEPAAEQQVTKIPVTLIHEITVAPGMTRAAADKDADTSPAIPAVPPSVPDPAATSFDMPPVPAEDSSSPDPMPGEAGYVEHMLRVSRSQQGTRVTRQQG